jgi:PAS domain S-box-containing protein
MVVGLNPYRPFDEDYRGFLRLLADQLASRLASAQVYENERRRSQSLAEAVRLRQEAAQALQLANERLSSEVALRTQERDRLQRLFQQAPSFMCLLEGPQHVFRLVNEAYLQLVGHRDLVGLPVREALPEVAGQGFFELLDELYRSGEAFIGRSTKIGLQRTPGAPVEERLVDFVFQPIVGPSGQVTGIFAQGYDVTERHLAEEALRESEERFRLIADSARTRAASSGWITVRQSNSIDSS